MRQSFILSCVHGLERHFDRVMNNKYRWRSGDWVCSLLRGCSRVLTGFDFLLKQVALILFSSLTETIGDLLRPHFATLQSVFISGLNDQQSNRVRVAALK